jgi:imidazolonepropionase-like amidohydrolase
VDDRLGLVEAGKQANIIAIKGELDESFDALRHVKFVMNKGTVIKNETV